MSLAPFQYTILDLLLEQRKPMSLREITNRCQLTYQQVASCLSVLRAKGLVTRVQRGLYKVTEEAKLMEFPAEAQVKILKKKIEELENQIQALLIKLSKVL